VSVKLKERECSLHIFCAKGVAPRIIFFVAGRGGRGVVSRMREPDVKTSQHQIAEGVRPKGGSGQWND